MTFIHCMGHFRLEIGAFFLGKVLVTGQEFGFCGVWEVVGLAENNIWFKDGRILKHICN
jgi:hypothetical protein